MTDKSVLLRHCVTWIVENTDITWAQSFKPVVPPEAKMCVELFGLSDLYFAGLLLDERRGKMRDEFTAPFLN